MRNHENIPEQATTRVASRGPCAYTKPHQSHTFVAGVDNAGITMLHECCGQYSHCSNCDDQGCMDCVLRVWHDACTWSCPFCEEGDANYLEAPGYVPPPVPEGAKVSYSYPQD